MRKIVLVVSLLLSGCQTFKNDSDHVTSQNKETLKNIQVNDKSTLYDRYKKANHRYLQKQDGAPVKSKKIEFVEPKPIGEPLSRYGNPTEYHVDGRTYTVMTHSTGYKTRGVASWYGTKFHEQRTSSGEPYNMYVMTAAHKTLPLPTYVKVRNLENGREAVVKVNDRGPFHADRIIDLSYAAAVKLGVYPKGTAHVEIETLKGPKGQANYYLQAGAFTKKHSADRLKQQLLTLSPSPVFIEHDKEHFVVRVGPFASRSMVDSLKKKLVKSGITGSFSLLI